MPKTYYCWRCEMAIPMMTAEEWAEVHPLLVIDIKRVKEYRAETGKGLREAMDELRHKACERYYELTGFRETNPNALWHHYLALYGPECKECGQLFRTPKASFCANCGATRENLPV